MTAPFGRLTPDFILSAVEAAGLRCDGRLQTLNSYENRVYQVGIEDDVPLIAKFYRPERWSDAVILEEHTFLAELAEAEIPVVPALPIDSRTLHHVEGFRLTLFPRRGGRAPELDRPEVLTWLGRFLGRIHAVGARAPFAHRPTLDIHSFGEEPRDALLASPFLPHELRVTWQSVVEQALEGIRDSYERAGPQPLIRLHGDVHGGNVLWTDAGPHFVDFDDARNGPAVQDLWMLLSGDAQSMARQLDSVLEGYEQFADFNPASLHLVEALRTLRLIHYAAWIARRWDDPAFPAAFGWFDSPRYWQEMILALREQVALMAEGELVRLC
ncbi:serine/threonine protein kinase [Zoogloea sp.]|uniref:serine/threonine protein kinase n=1 Tax=Zoogloea sp. TaxID=49181 RepID=UPI00262CF2E1|nr:serine/threonine protein kinase [Zoogloea sp.]MDD3352419.1 serine/threonine protein kinase [Zoogloea sp.]